MKNLPMITKEDQEYSLKKVKRLMKKEDLEKRIDELKKKIL